MDLTQQALQIKWIFFFNFGIIFQIKYKGRYIVQASANVVESYL